MVTHLMDDTGRITRVVGPNGEAKISRRRNLYGEWTVRFYPNHAPKCVEPDYFTEDRVDAVDTAESMVK